MQDLPSLAWIGKQSALKQSGRVERIILHPFFMWTISDTRPF